MKILTFRRFIGLAALGGFAYVHKQRGGDWTMNSIKGTLRHLWSSASDKADQVREATRDNMPRAASASDTAARIPESSARSYAGYSRRDDDGNRH